MPESFVKVKYPSVQRPQIIKTDLTTTVNFCFSLLDVQIEEGQEEQVRNIMSEALKQAQPANIFYDKK